MDVPAQIVVLLAVAVTPGALLMVTVKGVETELQPDFVTVTKKSYVPAGAVVGIEMERGLEVSVAPETATKPLIARLPALIE